MVGAIIGDIVGSRFEFDIGGKTKEFELFTDRCSYTDDSVMTIALADCLMSIDENMDDESIKKAITSKMQEYGRKYPNAGYGSRFIGWIFSSKPEPYNSYGNGSAMRVSSVGWLYNSLEKTRKMARLSAEVSHNHIEGIKGAECTATVIYLSRTNHSKEEIKQYIDKQFNYDLSESLEEMRLRHKHDESCMDSLPKALKSFMDGNSFEDVIRNAISLGGDADTIAAIAGSMAEAYYGIPQDIKEKAYKYLPDEFIDVIDRFNNLTLQHK